MRWIKASDRKPGPYEPKHLKIRDMIGSGEYNSYKEIFIGPGGFIDVPMEEIYWLDESAPDTGEIERLKAENEKMRKALERADAEINSLYQENGTWGSAVLQEIREALKITQ